MCTRYNRDDVRERTPLSIASEAAWSLRHEEFIGEARFLMSKEYFVPGALYNILTVCYKSIIAGAAKQARKGAHEAGHGRRCSDADHRARFTHTHWRRLVRVHFRRSAIVAKDLAAVPTVVPAAHHVELQSAASAVRAILVLDPMLARGRSAQVAADADQARRFRQPRG